MGGQVEHPSYDDVCTGDTGHAEVVQIRFDPAQLGYRDLLEVFFAIHDPTTPNRQGNDIGTQYRSAIFYHSPGQRTIAEEVIARMGAAKLWREPIVTEVAPASAFWVAEDYHQEYFSRNPRQSYCMLVVDPKVSKFRKHFRDRLKK